MMAAAVHAAGHRQAPERAGRLGSGKIGTAIFAVPWLESAAKGYEAASDPLGKAGHHRP